MAANGGGLGARNTEVCPDSRAADLKLTLNRWDNVWGKKKNKKKQVKYVASLEDSLAGLKLMWMDQKW